MANQLKSKGWTQVTTNVFERNGYTMLLRVDHVLVISPIGKRAVRSR
jgi:hypothetical protein